MAGPGTPSRSPMMIAYLSFSIAPAHCSSFFFIALKSAVFIHQPRLRLCIIVSGLSAMPWHQAYFLIISWQPSGVASSLYPGINHFPHPIYGNHRQSQHLLGNGKPSGLCGVQEQKFYSCSVHLLKLMDMGHKGCTGNTAVPVKVYQYIALGLLIPLPQKFSLVKSIIFNLLNVIAITYG